MRLLCVCVCVCVQAGANPGVRAECQRTDGSVRACVLVLVRIVANIITASQRWQTARALAGWQLMLRAIFISQIKLCAHIFG